MYWFKHKTSLRDTAEMKQVMRMGGNEAVGIAYKFIEVGAGRINDANDFSTVVELDPMEANFFAAEVIGPVDGHYGYGDRPANIDDLVPYLEMFVDAGLITLDKRTAKGTRRDKEGKRIPCDVEIQVIDFKILADCVDDYTARSRRKAEKEAKAKRRAA